MDATGAGDRVTSLERAVRSLSREDIARFVPVVREQAAGRHNWPPDRRFVFDGTADLKMSADDEAAVRALWTRMNSGLVFAATGREVDGWIDRPGIIARLERIGSRSRQVEGWAATILEREFGGEVWLGVIGIWNALCAALFEDRMSASLRDDLTLCWRQVKALLPTVAS